MRIKLLPILLGTFMPLMLSAGVDDDDDVFSKEKFGLQELFNTRTVFPQETDEIQLSLFPIFQKNSAGKETTIIGEFEYGLTDSWQVELGWEIYKIRNPDDAPSTNGIGNFEIGTKYSFMNMDETDFSMALGFEIEFPTGDINKELTEGFIEYEPYVVLANDFPQFNDAQIFLEIGFSFVQRVKNAPDPDDNEPSANEFILNGGFFIPIEPFYLVAELNWRTNKWNHGGDENELYATPGVIVTPLDDVPLQLGVGVPIGLNQGADHYQIIGMLVYEFE